MSKTKRKPPNEVKNAEPQGVFSNLPGARRA
jgi:hypothetical protein